MGNEEPADTSLWSMLGDQRYMGVNRGILLISTAHSVIHLCPSIPVTYVTRIRVQFSHKTGGNLIGIVSEHFQRIRAMVKMR